METAASSASAVKTWVVPPATKQDTNSIYPKEQARLLAKGTGQPVPIAPNGGCDAGGSRGNVRSATSLPRRRPTRSASGSASDSRHRTAD
jgi:hypothetical protein